MVAKTGVTFDDERLKFQNDDNGDCAVNTIVNNTVKVDITESGDYLNGYFEISGVVGGATEVIINYTIPSGKTLELKQIDFSGDNIAIFKAEIDGNIINKNRTWWANFNGFFGFKDYPISAGKILKLVVENCGDETAGFNGNFQGRLLSE